MTDWDELWEQVKPEGEPPSVSGELGWALIVPCPRDGSRVLRTEAARYPEPENLLLLEVGMLCDCGHIWTRRMDRGALRRLIDRRCLVCGEHRVRVTEHRREPAGFKALAHCGACDLDDEREVPDVDWITDD